jgi:hypothetical protein
MAEIPPSGDPHDAQHSGRGFGVDVADTRVAVQRADEAGMHRAGDGEVVDVARGAGEEPAVLASQQGAADRAAVRGSGLGCS